MPESSSIKFPKKIRFLQKKLEASTREYVRIKLRTMTTDSSLTQSKIGGYPYFPKTWEYPRNYQEQPMALLAQFNFDEIPSIPDFQDTGLLQFFVCPYDNFGLYEGGFLVNYYPKVEPEQAMSDLSFLDNKIFSPLKIRGKEAFELSFTKTFGIATPASIEFAQLTDYYRPSNEDFLWLGGFSRALGHKLGGYPDFVQGDPRKASLDSRLQEYQLLFQLDSDTWTGLGTSHYGYSILWGDVGVGNFFIHLDDLKQRDFSRVFYEWTCG